MSVSVFSRQKKIWNSQVIMDFLINISPSCLNIRGGGGGGGGGEGEVRTLLISAVATTLRREVED